MRIVHVNDVAHVASSLAEAQRALGHDARVLDPSRLGFGPNRLVRLLTLPWRWASLLAITWTLRRERWDVVHAHYGWRAFVVRLARRRYVLHFHGTDVRRIEPQSLRGRLNRSMARNAEAVYYATPDLAEWVLPLRRDARFLPNPIDVRAFERPGGGQAAGAAAERTPTRSAGGAATRDLLVGVRLDPIKGLDTVVETIREVVARRPATTITVVAQGSGVAAATAAAGPSAEVVGRLGRRELPALLHRHRLALGQFRVGAIGNYELECLAAGLPVVMRFDYDDAYETPPPLVKAETAAEAAARIVELLDDESWREELGRAGHDWVRAEHDAISVAARVLADYEALGLGA